MLWENNRSFLSFQVSTFKEDQENDFNKVIQIRVHDDLEIIEDWIQMFMELPSGIHRVALGAQRSTVGSTGLAVDDFTMQSCTSFG